MKRNAFFMVALMVTMSLSTVIADIPAPNDVDSSGQFLSVDGYVTTKYASVGDAVEIVAMTRGHSDDTVVTAQILRFPMSDPMDFINSQSVNGDGIIIGQAFMTRGEAHEDDPNTMMWSGKYTVPASSLGGMYGARIIAEDGALRATDDPTQLNQLINDEIVKVLQAIDDGWQTAKPTQDIKDEFDDIEDEANENGGWTNFVSAATEGGGTGGTAQLWDSMIEAGHNQYNMSAGANFLEALMELLDSDDVDAGMALVSSLLIYLDEFPLPRTFDDFPELGEYLMAIDPIENFTRFEGTGDFEAAYNAMLGSDEWTAMEEALDNLINNVKPFESFQTILHNIALLSVSAHPEAIVDGLIAFLEPLMEEDFDSMTPFQKFVYRFVQMAEELGEEDVVYLDDDDAPDQIFWQYEKLMQEPEGQAWATKVESDTPWVNDIFDMFDILPENCIGHLYDAVIHPIWEGVGETLMDFADWADNFSGIDRYMYWPDYNDEEDEEDDGWAGEDEDAIIFHELYDVRTSLYDPHVLMLGIELNIWGELDGEEYPDKFSMKMTNHLGDDVWTDLEQSDYDDGQYRGILEAPSIRDTVWTFSQPLEDFEGDIDNAELSMEALYPSMLELALFEGLDEMFIVSALGVVVTQDETVTTGSDYTVSAMTYAANGTVVGSKVDIAVMRVSPQVAEDAIESMEPEGEVWIYESNGGLEGRYTGSDLDGDIEVSFHAWGEHIEDEWESDLRREDSANADFWHDETGSGSLWNVHDEIYYELSSSDRGIVEIVTSGTTTTGIEFSFIDTMPLPESPGCMYTEAHRHGGNDVGIDWNYKHFETDGDEFDRTELLEVNIDWGDGTTGGITDDSGDDGSAWHDYGESTDDTYYISVEYVTDGSVSEYHWFTYREEQGFERSDEEGNTWYEYSDRSFEQGEWDYCNLQYQQMETLPSPQIIDSFITDGPFEVMKEEISDSDSSGMATMTVTPSLPGVYPTVVQSKYTRPDGETLTGVGMNLAMVSEGTMTVTGNNLEDINSFSGIPVLAATPGGNGKMTITITPEGLNQNKYYDAWIGVAQMDLSTPFPNIDKDTWGETSDYELEFEPGDTSRSVEITVNGPFALMSIAMFESSCSDVEDGDMAPSEGYFTPNSDEEDEYWVDEDDEFWDDGTFCAEANFEWPFAGYAAIVLNDPGELDITGDLGPGQDANVALSAETGEASRILALAAPTEGFDPASIDFSSFLELAYGEVRHREAGWVVNENKVNEVCEEFGVWYYEDVGESMLRAEWSINTGYWADVDVDDYTPPSIVVTDGDGNEISPHEPWTVEEWNDGTYYASFEINPDDGPFTFTSGSDIGLVGEFELIEEDSYYYMDDDWANTCNTDIEPTEEEAFEIVDELLSNLKSVAWGIGSSADLSLSVLSAPMDNYTVMAIAQIGSGDSATMVSAIGNDVALPNPEPPVMTNLTVGFSHDNPIANDTVTITVTDENQQVVNDVSVLLTEGNTVLFGIVLNDTGQASFKIPEGTLVLYVEGGMYNPYNVTIIVGPDGTTTGDGEGLPVDTDGDGVLDSNDNCTGTPAGDDVDEHGCTVYPDTDGDGVTDDMDAFPNDANESADSDGDGIGDNADKSDGLSSNDEGMNDMMMIGGGVVAVLLLVILVLVGFMMRRADDEDWDEYADTKWDAIEDPIPSGHAPPVSSAPSASSSSPSPDMVGEMIDGYEAVEYPNGSGVWWYKDQNSGQWMEWN